MMTQTPTQKPRLSFYCVRVFDTPLFLTFEVKSNIIMVSVVMKHFKLLSVV